MLIILKISDGPSKFDLMASLFDKKEVEFTLETNEKRPLRVHVQSVEREDGSGESWNLKILVMSPNNPTGIFVNRRYEAYYNSRTRRGKLKVSEQ